MVHNRYGPHYELVYCRGRGRDRDGGRDMGKDGVRDEFVFRVGIWLGVGMGSRERVDFRVGIG